MPVVGVLSQRHQQQFHPNHSVLFSIHLERNPSFFLLTFFIVKKVSKKTRQKGASTLKANAGPHFCQPNARHKQAFVCWFVIARYEAISLSFSPFVRGWCPHQVTLYADASVTAIASFKHRKASVTCDYK